MSGTIQTVTLHSEQHFGKRLPPKAFGNCFGYSGRHSLFHSYGFRITKPSAKETSKMA